MRRDQTKLPKWAQRVITELRSESIRANTKLNNIEKAHETLTEREWFTVNYSDLFDKTWSKSMSLNVIHLDKVQPICSISEGDIVLIGRSKK